MQRRTILLLSYWYPNKSNQNFGIFVKRHAHAIKEDNDLTILSISILKSKSLFRKTTEVSFDEKQIETHRIYLESRFNKLLYVLLPIHYLIIKNYVLKNIKPVRSFSHVHSNVIFPCGII